MIDDLLRRQLRETRTRFEAMLSRIASMSSGDIRLQLAYRALYAAWNTGHGYYSSDVLENVFVEQARSLPCTIQPSYIPSTCLIVLTTAYLEGGHTRVVERWIEEDEDRRYSVALVKQGDQAVPPRLVMAVKNSGGAVFEFPKDLTDIQRAIELRRLSAKFESVVLHTHMDDAVPLIAYGTEEFRRPVGLYNHADHRFWLGLSVTDLVADLRSWGRKITLERRGAEESFLLTIPRDCAPIKVKPKLQARRELGVREDGKLIVTVGSSMKYRPLLGIDFLDLVRPILDQRKDVVVLGIGMTMKDYPAWAKVSEQHGGRLKAIGTIPHDSLYDWYFAADLVLDSRPTSGETALMDATTCGCPVLTEMNPTGLMEWTINSPAFCRSDAEVVDRALRILDDSDFARAHIKAVMDAQTRYNSQASFRRLLKEYFDKLLSRGHRVHDFAPKFSGFTDLDAYHYIMGNEIDMKIDLGCLFRKYTKKDGFSRQKVIEIFGREFVRNHTFGGI